MCILVAVSAANAMPSFALSASKQAIVIYCEPVILRGAGNVAFNGAAVIAGNDERRY